MSAHKPQAREKTMVSKIAQRLKVCDTMRGEAIQDIEALRREAISKHDQPARAGQVLTAQAQQNPARYGNIAVRVAGYSQMFKLINKDLQEHIIARTKHKG